MGLILVDIAACCSCNGRLKAVLTKIVRSKYSCMTITYTTGKFEGLCMEIKVRGTVTIRLQACLQPRLRTFSFENVNIFLASSLFLD